MNKVFFKKNFGEDYLNKKKIIILAVIMGVYTSLISLLPFLNNTSFHDITVSFEVWILFGIIIIMKSKSAKDSSINCFLFFLISQPLVYLLQVPFSDDGFEIFRYYNYWFIWTLLTIPMGYIGYFMKKDKWWSLLILLPILLLLGLHYYDYLRKLMYYFPYHLLTVLFCFTTLLVYPIFIFKNKKNKISGLSFSVLLIIIFTIGAIFNRYYYKTSVLISGDNLGVLFNDTYKVYLDNEEIGSVYIEYDDGIDEYAIYGKFVRAGDCDLILEDAFENKIYFDLDVEMDSYKINKKDNS